MIFFISAIEDNSTGSWWSLASYLISSMGGGPNFSISFMKSGSITSG